MLFSGSSHEQLARKIALMTKMRLGKALLKQFPDGEISITLQESVEGKDLFFLQSMGRNSNFFLMEAFLMADLLKRANCASLTAIIPYLGYTRQDRGESATNPISAKLIASLLEKAGFDKIITIDLHADQIEGFFSIPVKHIFAKSLFAKKIQQLQLENLIVIAPDIGRAKFAERFAKDLNCDLAVINKIRVDNVHVSGKLLGDIAGRDVLIVDDILSTGKTLATAKKVCKNGGAKKIFACITHAVSEEVCSFMDGLDGLFITDSLPQNRGCEVISISSLLADAIKEKNTYIRESKSYETDCLSTI